VTISVTQVSQEQFVDAGERDTNGFYDCYYSGWTYVLKAGEVTYRVVCYDDEPGTAVFKGTEIGGRSTLTADQADPTFQAVVRHLARHHGINRVSTYEPVLGYFQSHEIRDIVQLS
jgi:hypothetical protein